MQYGVQSLPCRPCLGSVPTKTVCAGSCFRQALAVMSMMGACEGKGGRVRAWVHPGSCPGAFSGAGGKHTQGSRPQRPQSPEGVSCVCAWSRPCLTCTRAHTRRLNSADGSTAQMLRVRAVSADDCTAATHLAAGSTNTTIKWLSLKSLYRTP